jgi:hypothetical protein
MSAIDSTADSPDARLVADLVKAQAAFPTIAKDQKATIPGKNGGSGFGYSYASLGTVLSAVRPVLSEHSLALVQRTVCTANGKVNLLTELRHGGGGVLSSEVEIGQSSGNPQQFGGALTYLRRYEIVTLLGNRGGGGHRRAARRTGTQHLRRNARHAGMGATRERGGQGRCRGASRGHRRPSRDGSPVRRCAVREVRRVPRWCRQVARCPAGLADRSRA